MKLTSGGKKLGGTGEGLASDLGSRVSSHPAPGSQRSEESSAQTQREGIPGEGGRSQHRLPRHRSPRGWEVLALDGHGRGEGGMPRSKPTETSGLLGLEDPRAKRGDSKDSNESGLSSHSVATGFPEKDPTRGCCFDEGERGEMRGAPGPYLKVGTSHPPGEVGHPKDSEEQRWSRRVKPLPPYSGWGHGLHHPLARGTFLH